MRAANALDQAAECSSRQAGNDRASEAAIDDQATDLDRPASRCWGLFKRKVRWSLSLRGWAVLGALCLAFCGGLLFGLHGFLAVTHRVDAQVLVVEGWISRYALRGAKAEFDKGHYEILYTTGGPEIGSGGYVNDAQTAAGVSADFLLRTGMSAHSVQRVPSHEIGRDRTYHSALALRDWLHQHNSTIQRVNVLTEDAHGRRTRLLFEMAFGGKMDIGIISVPNPDYDAARWWRYSEGVREVLGEGLAYIYARCFFHPGRAEDVGTGNARGILDGGPLAPTVRPQGNIHGNETNH